MEAFYAPLLGESLDRPLGESPIQQAESHLGDCSAEPARGIHRRVSFSPDAHLRKRFDAKFVKRSESECWPWIGGMRNGYGAIKHGRHTLGAHVVAHVIAGGRFPAEGEIVCHTCDNR
jgi:hypothetical protein